MYRRPRKIIARSLLLAILFCTCVVTPAEELPAASIDPALAEELANVLRAKNPSYRPRTEHLNADASPRYTNRLLLEDSPYLTQHAHNPVNWFPWGADAFAKAKREDKPIFLSIGYSTCHWCHVMEKDSFDNVEIARFLNKHFIAIKVDRERRPDIDATYMTAVRLLTQSGGWPMSSFLTVDGNTFWAGTYYPPREFSEVLRKINQSWLDRRADIEQQAEKIAGAVAELTRNKQAAQRIDHSVTEKALAELYQSRDQQYGGLGQDAKFPQASVYLFLIDNALRSGDANVAAWVKFDLDAIANGGIHDHIGGGFHRYATDRRWIIPHFEKMLYTQAQLLRVYTHAYQLFGDKRYALIVDQIVAFLDREMASAKGGYYSALDADSPDGEGLFYVWKRNEIESLLEPKLGALATDWFNVSESGNFDGANVLNLTQGFAVFAKKHGLSPKELSGRITRIQNSLLGERAQRVRPLRDEKIVTSWNAMTITALAEASIVFDKPAYLERAMAGAEYLLRTHVTQDGGLWRSTHQGIGGVRAVAADFAALSESFIALYDATGEAVWLDRAQATLKTLRERYWDSEHGAYFMSALAAGSPSMARPKSLEDSAVPSGNAMVLAALVGLNERIADLALEKHADELVAAIAGDLSQRPSAHTYALRANEIFHSGGNGPIWYAARGAVRISTRRDQDIVIFELAIKEGWHIQAHQPLQKDLVGTTLAVAEPGTKWRLRNVSYPEPVIKSLSFRGEGLALYESNVRIGTRISASEQQDSGMLRLMLTLQACNDRVCLPPDRVALNFRVGER